jgi:hypothetical protein
VLSDRESEAAQIEALRAEVRPPRAANTYRPTILTAASALSTNTSYLPRPASRAHAHAHALSLQAESERAAHRRAVQALATRAERLAAALRAARAAGARGREELLRTRSDLEGVASGCRVRCAALRRLALRSQV